MRTVGEEDDYWLIRGIYARRGVVRGGPGREREGTLIIPYHTTAPHTNSRHSSTRRVISHTFTYTQAACGGPRSLYCVTDSSLDICKSAAFIIHIIHWGHQQRCHGRSTQNKSDYTNNVTYYDKLSCRVNSNWIPLFIFLIHHILSSLDPWWLLTNTCFTKTFISYGAIHMKPMKKLECKQDTVMSRFNIYIRA